MSAPSTSGERIGALGIVFGVAVAVLVVHLWLLMVGDHGTWAARSHENRWAFRSVPSQRGALLDRHGRVLVEDEPTTELGIYYKQFRQNHPVGAAVHGATLWARVVAEAAVPPTTPVEYHFGEGEHGALQAARDLLAVPVRNLRQHVLPNDVANALQRMITTVLAQCSGQSRRRVSAALRKAATAGAVGAVGDVLPIARQDLLQRYAARLAALHALDAELTAQRAAAAAADPWAAAQVAEATAASGAETAAGNLVGDDAEIPVWRGLFPMLEHVRRQMFAEPAVATAGDPDLPDQAPLEETVLPIAMRVPYELAAEVRVGSSNFAGILVLPAVARRFAVDHDSTLRRMLGDVGDLERKQPKAAVPDATPVAAAPGEEPDEQELERRRLLEQQQKQRESTAKWVQQLVDRHLPAEWAEELANVPLDEAVDDDARMLDRARTSLSLGLMQHERAGLSGFEAAFDARLTGRLGMRLVERDRQRREQRQWSHLHVEAGDDVQITLDRELQKMAEAAVRSTWRRAYQRHAGAADQDRVESALAVIDARSGDILAFAGAPLGRQYWLPGAVWTGNGALGSVVKPFVLVEQLQAERDGRPHRPMDSFEDCDSRFRYEGQTLRCTHAHWGGGKDAIEAIAESCNEFFYQCSLGLGRDGVLRSLRRFGLCPPLPADDPFAACWQKTLPGLLVARPVVDTGRLLPQQAIGYGVAASPLHVARAYAAFATGALPTLGFESAPRSRVPLHDVVGDLAFVEQGLRRCVTSGTAQKLTLLLELGVLGKTGTAEVDDVTKANNGWFAGYLPFVGTAGQQLCFCAVVYRVPNGMHGGDAAGQMVADFLAAVQAEPVTQLRYLVPEGGR